MDTAELVQNSLNGFDRRRGESAARYLDMYAQISGAEKKESFSFDGVTVKLAPVCMKDICANAASFNLHEGKNVDAALNQIIRTALWFDLPHPTGRDPRGESTFAAMGLLPALYYAADRLSAEARAAVDRFFLTKNFESMYESENHRLQHHTALYLAGQFYGGRVFEWRGQTGDAIAREEGAWLKDFIRFRAKESWGEFDSCGYLAVDFGCLLLLAEQSRDAELAGLSRMMLDVLLLDMAVDSKGGLYGGAHGRIYPPSALDASEGGMQALYYLYIGGARLAHNTCAPAALLCAYRPSRVVLEVALGREGSYENREAKHLHCIPQAQQPGRISKYTYVTDRYIVGAINRQDPYIPGTPQCGYAHHEQHELDALILADPRAKVFTHHPGRTKEHNRWTGDLGCCCTTTCAWRNVAMAMYDIAKPEEYAYIAAHFNRRVMRNVRLCGKWVFGELNGVYAALYGSSGWAWACDELRAKAPRSTEEHAHDDDEIELWSEGRRHGCVIELSDMDDSLDAFIARILANKVAYDAERHTLTYETNGHVLFMDAASHTIDGAPEAALPYEMHDCPYLQSRWDDLRVRANGFSGSKIYDFEAVKVIDG